MMRWIGLLGLSTMTVLLWAGCSGGVEHGDGGPGAACKSDADCMVWEGCTAGVCQGLPCTTNADCGAGAICDDCVGRCSTPECTTDADCGDSFCNAGTCAECLSDADCGTGGCDCGFCS